MDHRSSHKEEEQLIMWQNCNQLALVQLELGGYFYNEQPQNSLTWKSQDTSSRQLLDDLSTPCIRGQCFDNLKHPKSGRPVSKSSRIQSNDAAFVLQFGQWCIGHSVSHASHSDNSSDYPQILLSTGSAPLEVIK